MASPAPVDHRTPRVNPLAPVAYTPKTAYGRPSQQPQSNAHPQSPQHQPQPPPQPYQAPPSSSPYQLQHHHLQYNTSNATPRRSTEQTSAASPSRDHPSHPIHPPSSTKLALVHEEDHDHHYHHDHLPSRPQQNLPLTDQQLQLHVASLNIASPPRTRPQNQGPVGAHGANGPTPHPLPGSRQHQQQQQQEQQQLLENQQPYHPYTAQQQHPYADGHQYPHPHPHPSPSPSQLYRASTGSSTTQSTWSQPSSPGFPPPSPFAVQHSLRESFQTDGPVLSEAAQQLIDFNPGILSTIAVAFREKMLQNETKRLESANYGLEFPVTFTGKETVDVICELTKSDDRRHALAIARSLEHQQLFFGGGINMVLFDSNNDQYFFSETALAFLPGKSDFPNVPTGVFPYTTQCYSYGCQPGESACYSYLCPNRQSAANVLGRQNSDVSAASSQEKVWANSVPASVVAAASKQERNRQEAIFEVINTEHNYVRDLELLEEIFITPLRAGDIVDPERREALIEDVFLNFKEILALNKALLSALRVRQEQQPLVESIGDILLQHVLGFEQAYTKYIPQIAISEYTYKKEEARNPKFAQFLQEATRHPEARRLNLRHFIGQPYQRIPRYPLLLREVVKRTDEGVPDRETVQEVIRVCTELGKHVDACIPEGNKRLRLLTIQDKIIWKSGEPPQDLKLSDKDRQLHFECIVKRRSHMDVQMIELRLFLFDHMLLMTKEKRDKLGDKESMLYQVSKHPIPLELVNVFADDSKTTTPVLVGREIVPGRKLNNSTKSNSSVHRNSTHVAPMDVNLAYPAAGYRVGFQESRYTAPVTMEHRGRKGGIYTLYMMPADREEFMEQLETVQARRQEIVSGSNLFQTSLIAHMSASIPFGSSPALPSPMDGKRITCSAPYHNFSDGRSRVVVGSDDGVYVGFEDDPTSFRLALREVYVSQVSVLEAYHLLLVLTGKVLKAFNLSCLDENSEKALHAGQQLGKSVQFFSAGTCVGKTLVITMKRKNAGESHFSAYEPVENAVLGGSNKSGFSLSFGKSNKSEWFKLYREFYVGTDSSQLLMLAKMVCVVCPKGFEVLMLNDLSNTQVFPPRMDPAFAFLEHRTNSAPISMFKINANEFLMCYSDFAFTMTKKGELAKKEMIEWEGRPESFALAYPYIVAFESGLVEIRHVVTGALEQIILGNNIRRLYANVDLNGKAVIQFIMSDPARGDLRQIVKLTEAPRSNIRNDQYMSQQHQGNGSAHLRSAALAPVLSTTGSGPAVLATHTLVHAFGHQQQQQQLPQQPKYYKHHPPPPQPKQPLQQQHQHQPVVPPRPSPSPKMSNISYPVHPYSPAQQAYPQVYPPTPESPQVQQHGMNGNGHHHHHQQQPPSRMQYQQQQQYQQPHQQHQQQEQSYQGHHATSWSSGGYP